MTKPTYQDPWVKKAKWLTGALIISGTLNVGLLSTFIYSAFTKDTPTATLTTSPDPLKSMGLQELLTEYSAFSFDDLLSRLSNPEHVESGYTHRDLALACLTSFHHFNLERALGGDNLPKRQIRFTHKATGEDLLLHIFANLTNDQYLAILNYVKTERWPLTSEGLFYEVKKSQLPHDPTLLEAFYQTPECHYIHLLFSKTGVPLKKEHIASLLSQGTWSILQEAGNYLRETGTFSAQERRRLLLDLSCAGSWLAGKVLLETDLDYCIKQLNNDQVLSLCNLLGDRASTLFLKELIRSPRSEPIWQKAAKLLYAQAAEEAPSHLDLHQVQQRFIHLKSKPRVVFSKKDPKTYTVVPGDSLWKIARAHNITVKALRQANSLESDRLRIGQVLNIPN